MGDTLTSAQVLEAGLDDWRQLSLGLYTRFATGGFAAGLDLLNAIGAVAEELDHHPDLDLRWGHLNIRTFSHDVNAVTERDVRLARRISELAAERGIAARPASVTAVELALDSAQWSRIKPFWQAVLGVEGGRAGVDDEVMDLVGQLPAVWFQETDEHETPRQRWHLDVWVPHDVADQRIAAATAAGGVVVDASEAPSFTVLADAEGNKACICTVLDRT